MNRFPFSPRIQRQRGMALVIMLAMLVLLTGIVVAFFSRAMSERQVADSSANRTRVELLSEGAVATMIGDLKQEIAAGSTTPAATDPATNLNLFFPKTATTVSPSAAGRPVTTLALPNLLKRSAYQQPFFSGADYDTANYPPSNRAANVSTTTLSKNFRSWSAARWNRALLLPKQDPTSDTDFTPVTGTDGFTAPDWVLVARDGSNPTTWDPALGNSKSNSFVVGRYAYTIYDEGGLLDMNAAGYPTGTTTAQAGTKVGLPLADLTQLVDSSGQPLLKQSEIDAIVGWRNYATAQPPAEFPSPGFNATSALNYFKASSFPSKGYLRTANTALYNDQSDRLFASREQMMKLILSGIASQSSSASGKAERARLQNALQYLTHYSRSLNQPSFRPHPDRPKVVAVNSGGNDAYTGDNILNPSFLVVRVPGNAGEAVFKRNDGTDAIGGEPLVKRRFALTRLAWLTHKGPIASDTGTLSTDSEVQTVITVLKSAGYTDDFLKLGGPANIYKYFGLSWVTDPGNSALGVWVYSHQDGAPLTTASPPKVPIKTLQGGSNSVSGREPDFFELLAATINVGAIGKASATIPSNGATNPDEYEAQKDNSTSAAIIQIAANLIDQFDADAYPTRILYDDGSWPTIQEYRGIEDLPYFYRVRGALMKIKESTPAITSRQPEPTPGVVEAGKEGLGVAFQQPEIWNPHTWNPNATATSLRPTSFRVTAVTAPPSLLNPPNPDPSAVLAQPRNRYQLGGIQDCPPSAAPLKSLSLTQDTTALLFDIPLTRRDLFREPTLLIKPRVPTGSNLRSGPNNYLETETVLAPYRTNGGLKNLVTSPFYTNNGATDDQLYIGTYLGAFPLLWTAKVSGVDSICNAFMVSAPAGKPVTYRVQYETTPGSGKWVTYDEKFVPIVMNGGANWQSVAGSRPNWIEPAYTIGNDSGRVFIDPRTARLGSATCAWQYNQSRRIFEWPPTYSSDWNAPFNKGTQTAGAAAPTGDITAKSYTAGAANQYAAQQNALWTIRPDPLNGFKAWPYPSSLGFYPTGMTGNNTGPQFRPGMYSQNNPAANAGGWAAAAGVGQGNTGTSSFFADPDNVVRRGMAAYVRPTAADAEQFPPTDSSSKPLAATGEPQAVATSYSSSGVGTPINTEAPSRPIVLNRPFRTVAEMGYASSGTPWRNLDFSTPESGFSALLDVFCINDTDDERGLVAGKVNLNTRQAPVLRAILAGAYKDEFASSTLLAATGDGSADTIAAALVQRTSDTSLTYGTGSGALKNVSELVGRWESGVTATGTGSMTVYDGGKSYLGFSGVETTSTAPAAPSGTVAPNLSYVLDQGTGSTTASYSSQAAQRYRETTIRALTAAGQTRLWNLMIDLVAQAGRYPLAAKGLDQFVVEGEQHRWIHVTIDRFTGEVIDQQVEMVKE